MSAVHGPIPWIAVSAAWASSAPISASEASASGPLATPRAISWRPQFFAANKRRRGSRTGRARIIACGSIGSNAAASRPQIAEALAVVSCCETTVATRPAKPSGRRRSGGRPARAINAAKRGSAAVNAASAMSRSVSVRMWVSMLDWMARRKDPHAPVSRSVAVMYRRGLRFAPSPNGYLHLGHAYSALLNSDMARELGGRLRLRIEDIDTERCRPEYEQAIYEDLRWLGMHWQESVRRQSEHFSDYEMAIGRLEADGLLYPSFESRRELAALTAGLDRHGGGARGAA